MGVTIGALLVRKLSKAAERLTPRSMATGAGEGLRELADAIRDFASDVRAAMHDRETELRAGTGLDGELGDRPSE
jgi:hypothetical protein